MIEEFKNGTEDYIPVSNALQAHGDFSARVFLPTASPTSSNRTPLEGSCILDFEATPDRKYGLESGTSLNNSVNSYGQKRRPSLDLHEFIHSKLDLSVSLESETEGNNRGSKSFPRTFSMSKHQISAGLDLDHKNGSNIDFDREMNISCSSCRSQLALPENNYHFPCTLASTSKSYLLTYESRCASTCSTSIMTENRCEPMSVLLTDISFINKRCIKQSKDVWCEQDGCVYRTISCFSCAVDTYLGLQVIAADAQNHHLINKVLISFLQF